MAQIIVAELEAYDPSIYGTRTLRFGTQAFVNSDTPIIEPTLDSRLTVTRAGTATRVNRLGLIESVAANMPRFDYDPVTKALKGLLIEESRQNLLLNSLLNGTNLSTQTVTVTAVAHTLSFYGSGSVVLSGASSATLNGAGAYPNRATLTFTPSAGSLTLTVTGTVQFANLEIGEIATSFIPTAGSAVTRNADALLMGGTSFSAWYNASAGTLFAEASSFDTRTTTGFARRFAEVSDGTTSNRMIVDVNQTLFSRGIAIAGGTTRLNGVDEAYTPGTVSRVALAYAAADYASSSNGRTPITAASGAVPTGIDRLTLGSQHDTANSFLNGHLRRVMYWPTRLTNPQLQALTAGQLIPLGAVLELDLIAGASAYFEGRIQQPANIKRECFRDGRTFGKTQIGFGEMVLVNMDGALDGLLNYSFVGRRITITLGTILPNMAAPQWTTILTGTMEQVDLSWSKATVRVRDRQLDLAKPLQEIRYAGTGGLEGGSDLEGKPKPLVYGRVLNISPPQTDTTRLIYQLHHGSQLVSVGAVYDRGTLLTAGAAYASQADMEANAPAANQYRVWNDATAGCFIRLGSAPTGTVTADVTQGATRTVGQLFNAILLKAGISSGSISAADITALDAAVNYEVGVFAGYDQDRSAIDMLDELCSSVGAWYGADASGIFRIGRIVLPTGAEVGTITRTDIIKIERIASRDPGVGVPSWRVKVAYEKIHTVQVDLGATVGAGRKQFTASEYRRAQASDASVKTANLLSPELEFKTVLTGKGDAASEATRLLNIYKVRRDIYQVTIRVDATLAAALDLGKIVQLQIDRFGMSAGKKFLIIGITTNMRGYLYELTLWG